MSQALYRRWRPQRWDDVAGQEHIIRPLKNAIKGARVGHAYLFAGPRGTGKTSTARLLAKAVNCLAEALAERPCGVCEHCVAIAEGSFLDLIEIDAASNTSVDDVRDLRDRINFAPNKGRYKVYIVDEVHMLSTAAFNALLKTLEEPPAHAIFILATTEVHKIPATVLSRCQRHEFRRLPLATIQSFLRANLEQEGLQADADAIELIARQATGSLRDAISLLDQLSSTGEKVTREYAELILGTAPHEAVGGVIDAIAGKQIGQGLAVINDAIDRGVDPRQLARQIVDYLRALLMIQMNNPELVDRPAEQSQQMTDHAGSLDRSRILTGIKAFSKVASERRTTWQSSLPLELAIIETAGDAAPSHPPSNPTPKPDVNKPATLEPSSATSTQSAEKPARKKETSPIKSASPPPELAGTITFEQILASWRDVLQAARAQDPRVQALLNSCRPLGVEDGRLVIGFSSDLLREKMEKEHNLRVAIKSLEQVFGTSLVFRCVLTETWQSGEYETQVPAPMADQGMVATALRELGAQVVDVERMPADSSSAESAS